MISAILASTALLAGAALADGTYGSTGSVGKAWVVNKCSYDVVLSNTPAAGGGYDSDDLTLKANGQYNQTWTELSNSQGWSIKLSKSESMANILQYEYTFHADGIIWYDLSAVNGNPWDANFEINSDSSSCKPRQAAYRYATDDAYGMQSCPQASEITVTLCSGEDDSGSSGSGSSAAPSSEASSYTSAADTKAISPPAASPTSEATTEAAPTTTAAPSSDSSETTSTPNWQFGHNTWAFQGKQVADAPSSQATTFATAVSSAPSEHHPPGVTVTQVATQVVTAYVTATGEPPVKRHAHHRRHPHERL